jgi:hypothetical protein
MTIVNDDVLGAKSNALSSAHLSSPKALNWIIVTHQAAHPYDSAYWILPGILGCLYTRKENPNPIHKSKRTRKESLGKREKSRHLFEQGLWLSTARF